MKTIINDLSSDLFEIINSDSRIDRNLLDKSALFSTFEIDYYTETDEYEEIQFDLAAQNTGNIYNYRHMKSTDEYVLLSIVAFSLKTNNYEIPRDVLKQIFAVAKDNKEAINRTMKRAS